MSRFKGRRKRGGAKREKAINNGSLQNEEPTCAILRVKLYRVGPRVGRDLIRLWDLGVVVARRPSISILRSQSGATSSAPRRAARSISPFFNRIIRAYYNHPIIPDLIVGISPSLPRCFVVS